MDQKKNSLAQILSSTSNFISNYETDIFYNKKNRFSNIEKPTYQNCIELLISLLHGQTNASVINNIYNIALAFSFLEKGKKEKKNSLVCEFKSQKLDNIQKLPKKYDSKAIAKLLNQFNINSTSHPYVFKTLISSNSTEIIKEVSTLSLIIILSSIQSRKSFSKIRTKFKNGVIKASNFIKKFRLKQDYLNELNSLIANHEFRKGFGIVIMESISNFTKSKKLIVERHSEFVGLIRKLFFLKHSEIFEYIDKIYSFLKDKLFMFSLILFLDEDSKSEILQWLPKLLKYYSESNPVKKRVIICYESLIRGLDDSKEYKLVTNRHTVSFYIGVIGDKCKFGFEFDDLLIDSKYYALGVQFRNYLLLNQIEDHFKFCASNKLTMSHDYLKNVLNLLNDSAGYPNLYLTGLNQMDNEVTTDNLRGSFLAKVNQQIRLIKLIDLTVSSEERKKLIGDFAIEQKNFKIMSENTEVIHVETTADESLVPKLKVKTNFKYDCKRKRLIITNSPKIAPAQSSDAESRINPQNSPFNESREILKAKRFLKDEKANKFGSPIKENKNIFNIDKKINFSEIKNEKLIYLKFNDAEQQNVKLTDSKLNVIKANQPETFVEKDNILLLSFSKVV